MDQNSTDTIKKISPPWTPEQVDYLNEQQIAGRVHPFTCGRCRDKLGTSFIREDDRTIRPMTEEEWLKDNDPFEKINGLSVFDEFMYPHSNNRYVHRERALVATLNGWICPTCDYTQQEAYIINT